MKQFLLFSCVFFCLFGSVYGRGWDSIRNSNENNLYDRNRDRIWNEPGYPNYYYGQYYNNNYFYYPVQYPYPCEDCCYDPYYYGNDDMYYPS